MKALPPIAAGCAPGSEHDSRGPGWYCCRCNTWHPHDAGACRHCRHTRCLPTALVDPETRASIEVVRGWDPAAPEPLSPVEVKVPVAWEEDGW